MSYTPGVVPKGIGNKIGPFDSTDLHSAKDKSEISDATRQAALTPNPTPIPNFLPLAPPSPAPSVEPALPAATASGRHQGETHGESEMHAFYEANMGHLMQSNEAIQRALYSKLTAAQHHSAQLASELSHYKDVANSTSSTVKDMCEELKTVASDYQTFQKQAAHWLREEKCVSHGLREQLRLAQLKTQQMSQELKYFARAERVVAQKTNSDFEALTKCTQESEALREVLARERSKVATLEASSTSASTSMEQMQERIWELERELEVSNASTSASTEKMRQRIWELEGRSDSNLEAELEQRKFQSRADSKIKALERDMMEKERELQNTRSSADFMVKALERELVEKEQAHVSAVESNSDLQAEIKRMREEAHRRGNGLDSSAQRPDQWNAERVGNRQFPTAWGIAFCSLIIPSC